MNTAGARVLKIDVLIDENGNARRALSELEGGVKKVEQSGTTTAAAVERLNAKFAETEKLVDNATTSVKEIGEVSGVSAIEMAGLSAGIGVFISVATAAGAAAYALGNYIKDASEYYIEQSGVLEINRDKVEELRHTWDALKYTIGEIVVGGDGDFRGWLTEVEKGLVTVGIKFAADIALAKELGRVVLEFGERHVNPSLDLESPGIDTTVRNPDGSLTPYGRLLEEKKKLLDPTRSASDPLGLQMPTFDPAQAERMTNEYISQQKREQLELEREQKKEAAERLRMQNEHVRLENDLTQAILRSKEAYDREIFAAERANAKRIESLSMSTKDAFLKSTLSGSDYDRYAVGAKADRAIAEIDPRAANADALRRQYEAEKEFAIIQMQNTGQGMTQGLSDDLNNFRIKYADILGSLPAEFQAIIPEIQAASGEMRDSMVDDLGHVQSKAGDVTQSFVVMGQVARASAQDIAAGLRAADRGYSDAFFVNYDTNVSKLRGQQTGGLLFGLGGYVEPKYFGLGGSTGVDTVPAMLRPGEGVLSRTGMAALDRLNAGGSVGGRGGVQIVIAAGAVDARGAQFSDDASLDRLADRLAQKVVAVSDRIGVN